MNIKHKRLPLLIIVVMLETFVMYLFGNNILIHECNISSEGMMTYSLIILTFVAISYLAYFLGCKDKETRNEE